MCPDQYAVRGIKRNCLVAAVLFGIAVIAGANTAIAITALVWLILGVLQYFSDVTKDRATMETYELEREQHAALTKAHHAEVAEYQRRRATELPAIRADLAIAERDLEHLQHQVAEQRRRQRESGSP